MCIGALCVYINLWFTSAGRSADRLAEDWQGTVIISMIQIRRGRDEIVLREKVVGNYLKNIISSRKQTKSSSKMFKTALERKIVGYATHNTPVC